MTYCSIVLEITETNLKGCGNRAFCKVAPVLWNDLNHELKKHQKALRMNDFVDLLYIKTFLHILILTHFRLKN